MKSAKLIDTKIETGKWIKADIYIDKEMDEIMISFYGPTGGVLYTLIDNIDAQVDFNCKDVIGFSLYGFLSAIKKAKLKLIK
jgi:hypothetical protein